MKHYFGAFLMVAVLFLASCSGSDVYQGNWKATDQNGAHFNLTFAPKSFSITDSTRKTVHYEYTQRSIQIKNSVRFYGIQLQDGRMYTISFPIENEITKGVILLQTNELAFTISRTDYLNYNDLYKLTQ